VTVTAAHDFAAEWLTANPRLEVQRTPTRIAGMPHSARFSAPSAQPIE